MTELRIPYDYSIERSLFGDNEHNTFDIFFDPLVSVVMAKLSQKSQPLGYSHFIRQCIKTGNDNEYVQSSAIPLDSPWKPTLRGKSIGRYCTNETDQYVKYGAWLARNWKNKSFYETPKIAVRETGARITATLDTENRYFLSSLYAIYAKQPSSTKEALKYILGIINSKLATWYVSAVAFELTKGAFTKIRTNQLSRLPIHIVDFTDPAERAQHDRMVQLVESMLELHKQKAAATTQAMQDQLQRQITETDRHIDQLVYALYGLNDEEIAIVEGR